MNLDWKCECLIKELAVALQATALSLNEDGLAHLNTNVDVGITLGYDRPRARLFIFSVLDEDIPSSLSRDWAVAQLENALNPLANPAKPGLGYDPSLQRLVGFYNLDVESCDSARLLTCVRDLTTWVAKRRENCVGTARPGL